MQHAQPEAVAEPPAASEQAPAAAAQQPAGQAVRLPTPVRMSPRGISAQPDRYLTGKELTAADLLRSGPGSQGQQQGRGSPEQLAAPAWEQQAARAPTTVRVQPGAGDGPRSQAARKLAAADLLSSGNSQSQQQDSGSSDSGPQPAVDTFEIAVEPTYMDVPVAFEE